jgi:hypothetical protein
MHCCISLKVIIIFRQDEFNHLNVKLIEIKFKRWTSTSKKQEVPLLQNHSFKALRIYFADHSRRQVKKKVKWQVIESYRRKHKKLWLQTTCIRACSGIIFCNSNVVFALTMRQIL